MPSPYLKFNNCFANVQRNAGTRSVVDPAKPDCKLLLVTRSHSRRETRWFAVSSAAVSSEVVFHDQVHLSILTMIRGYRSWTRELERQWRSASQRSCSRAARPRATNGTPIAWKKTVIEGKFRSEGVAIADVNKDGKPDVLIGDSWYEAPSWTKHDIRKPGDFGDGLRSYSKCMTCWSDDVNGDGWPDQIVIGFPGVPALWYENPKGKPGYWPEHEAWHSSCNETPLYTDLFGDGHRVLFMGWQPKGQKQRRTDGLVHARQRPDHRPGKCTRSASPARPARSSRAPSSSRTGSAPAT